MKKDLEKIAVLYSSVEPSEEQYKGFREFLNKKYGEIELVWEKNEHVENGFRLRVGPELYDWTVRGRFEQLKKTIKNALTEQKEDVIPLLKETIDNWNPKAELLEIGVVTKVYDGIARIKGLEGATFGEILLFQSGVKGMVQDIDEDDLGCILFDVGETVCQGDQVVRSYRTAGTPVGEAFLGRTVDVLGNPLDGLGEIKAVDYYPIEHKAPGIIKRKPVDTPLETGILSIDAMFPIGRGQRELIIGDRQTGKTTIALDTIINQKGKDVVCVYVAIGQKSSTVIRVRETLKKHGALPYTVIVAASASDPAPLQYIAPYSGCGLAEYFMHKGKDVLIVYDDLSKHAVAYRSLSLLLDRSPGREAYPGDVFYLHSRLLERAARLNDEYGGGSITALPIVETQGGDVAAYIPTNVISITDGQIFLESDLFFSGQRPAVNVGLSVSRVGGDAQTKAMKKAASGLKLDLAQYREMEVFNQFASDLDEATKNQLDYGSKLMRLLRQNQSSPLRSSEQVALLVTALNHLFDPFDVKDIPKLKNELLEVFNREHKTLLDSIEISGLLADETKRSILKISREYLATKNV
ncbi:MAG: F0F1 ATP synthase subunit alpha [Clostridia bacterium]|nr:F0F1 ATP synthase subunit alpha [Clostridia bacterium]